MIDQKFIDKELKSIFDGDYGADHDWHYNNSSSEIIQRFSAVFDSWDKLHKDTQKKLLRIAVETIMNEFPAEEETINSHSGIFTWILSEMPYWKNLTLST